MRTGIAGARGYIAMANTNEQSPYLTSAEARIIATSLAHIAQETKRNADAVAAIGESLHILTRLEASQANVVDKLREGSIRMTNHEDRLSLVERELPGLRETRKWVVAGVLAGISMMGGALVKLVIVDVPRMQQYAPVQPAPQQAGKP